MLVFKDQAIRRMYNIAKGEKARVKFLSEIEEKLEKNIELNNYEKSKLRRYKREEQINHFIIHKDDKCSIRYEVPMSDVYNLIKEFIELNNHGNLFLIKVSSRVIDINGLYTNNIYMDEISEVLYIDKVIRLQLCDADIIISKNMMIIINDLYHLSIEVSNYKSLKELKELEELERRNRPIRRELLKALEEF